MFKIIPPNYIIIPVTYSYLIEVVNVNPLSKLNYNFTSSSTKVIKIIDLKDIKYKNNSKQNPKYGSTNKMKV